MDISNYLTLDFVNIHKLNQKGFSTIFLKNNNFRCNNNYKELNLEKTITKGIENWHIQLWVPLIMSPQRYKANVNHYLLSRIHIDCWLVVNGRDPFRNAYRLSPIRILNASGNMVQNSKLAKIFSNSIRCKCEPTGSWSHQVIMVILKKISCWCQGSIGDKWSLIN